MEDKIIDKVKKLLALGQSDNPHEAGLAMAKAQELMAAHNLTLGKLRMTEIGHVDVKSKTSISTIKPYEQALFNLVAKAFGCRLFVLRGHGRVTMTWTFVGPRHQLPMCEWTVEVLAKRMAKARAGYVAARSIGVRSKELSERADAFCVGWVYEVSRKVYNLAGSSEWKDAIDEYIGVKLKTSGKKAQAKEQKLDYTAFLHGSAAAEGESLHRPMEERRGQGKIGHG